MRNRIQDTSIFIISYATTILNTMPIWLAELADKSGGTSTAIGLIASLVLTTAAIGCVLGSRVQHSRVVLFCGGIVCLGLLGASLNPTFGQTVLIAGSAVGGVASGVVLSVPLSLAINSRDMLRIFGHGMSFGCIASFVILAGTAATGVSLLPILAVLAGVQVVALLWPESSDMPRTHLPVTWAHDLSLFPFFVLMGSYWAFLEVFAREQGFETVSGWLAASLILSALGSFFASRVPDERRHRWRLFGLVLAAFAGGLTYLSFSEITLGMMILCNAFGLFLFFPLYLDGTDAPALGMARYLMGFALGGGAGSLILVSGGHAALAGAIVVSGLVAMPLLLRARPKIRSF